MMKTKITKYCKCVCIWLFLSSYSFLLCSSITRKKKNSRHSSLHRNRISLQFLICDKNLSRSVKYRHNKGQVNSFFFFMTFNVYFISPHISIHQTLLSQDIHIIFYSNMRVKKSKYKYIHSYLYRMHSTY